MPTIGDAIKLAVDAHERQMDKGGQPYILHPLRLMLAVNSEPSKIVALLHDVIEDNPTFTLENSGSPVTPKMSWTHWTA